MIEIVEDNFKFKEGYQVLYFYGTAMPFHKKMIIMLSNLEKKYNSVEFNVIDVFVLKSFIKRFNLIDVPTICIFLNGKEISRIRGVVLSSSLKSIFFNLIKVI